MGEIKVIKVAKFESHTNVIIEIDNEHYSLEYVGGELNNYYPEELRERLGNIDINEFAIFIWDSIKK